MTTCPGCSQPLEPLAQIRTYHTSCDPQGRVGMLERAIQEMIESVPGGSSCDPQKVCDTLRRIAESHGAALAEKGREG
jgi:hypothetical protein